MRQRLYEAIQGNGKVLLLFCIFLFWHLFFNQQFNTPKFEEFSKLFLKCIKQVLVCDRSSPFTKKSLDFITSCFKEMISFEEEFENDRLHKLAANENQNNNLNESLDESTLEDASDIDELGIQALDLDKTIVNTKYLSPISTVDLLMKNELVKYTTCKEVNIRYNTISLIKKTLETFNEIDEETFNVLRLVRLFNILSFLYFKIFIF